MSFAIYYDGTIRKGVQKWGQTQNMGNRHLTAEMGTDLNFCWGQTPIFDE
jgi:hypothetical protein